MLTPETATANQLFRAVAALAVVDAVGEEIEGERIARAAYGADMLWLGHDVETIAHETDRTVTAVVWELLHPAVAPQPNPCV